MILNVLFTGDEVRTVIERSDLPLEVKCHIWALFIDYATIDKRLNVVVTSKDSITESDAGDEHPALFL